MIDACVTNTWLQSVTWAGLTVRTMPKRGRREAHECSIRYVTYMARDVQSRVMERNSLFVVFGFQIRSSSDEQFNDLQKNEREIDFDWHARNEWEQFSTLGGRSCCSLQVFCHSCLASISRLISKHLQGTYKMQLIFFLHDIANECWHNLPKSGHQIPPRFVLTYLDVTRSSRVVQGGLAMVISTVK